MEVDMFTLKFDLEFGPWSQEMADRLTNLARVCCEITDLELCIVEETKWFGLSSILHFEISGEASQYDVAVRLQQSIQLISKEVTRENARSRLSNN